MEYKLLIDNVDYTKYWNLPAVISRENDNVLMTASVYLVGTTLKSKIHQNTDVEIDIDNNKYYFIVSGDEIEEELNSSDNFSKLYNHNLSLMDRFKLCDEYNLPDMCFSKNEEQFILVENKWTDNMNNIGNINPYKIFKTGTNPPFGNYFGQMWLRVDDKERTFHSDIVYKKYKYSKDFHINFSFGSFGLSCAKGGVNVYSEYDDEVRNDWLFPYYIDFQVKGGTYTDWNTLSTFTTSRAESKNYRKPWSGGNSQCSGKLTLPENLADGIYYLRLVVNWNKTMSQTIDGVLLKDKFVSLLKDGYPALGSWGNVGDEFDRLKNASANNFNCSYDLTIQIDSASTKKQYKPLSETCEKIFSQVRALKSGQQAQFSLDTTKASYYALQHLATPELTFEKKNLSEILREIGRIIEGVPHLTSDNKVYYDLLNIINDNPNHIDNEKLLEKTFSSLDNYATRMNTDVKNLIPSENYKNYSYFPAKDKWQYYRSADIDSGTIYPDNSAIRIDNAKNGGIYKILEFNIKNVFKNDPNLIIKLIQFGDDGELNFTRVPTKELYDSYSVDLRGVYEKDSTGAYYYNKNKSRGRNLYYETGDFKVVLSNITDAQRVVIFGTDKEYIYKYAILDAYNYDTGNNFETPSAIPGKTWNDIKDFKFQIKYIPNINAKYITEKVNVNGFKSNVQTTYAQDSNTVSEDLLATTTERYLKRQGNDDVSKAEFIEDSSKIPYLGEYLDRESGRYYCDVMKLNLYPYHIEASLNYTKNYNKINRLISNPKTYVQYTIPRQETVRKYINIDRYVYLRDTKTYTAYNTLYNPTIDTNAQNMLVYSGNTDLPKIARIRPIFKDGSYGEYMLVPIKIYYGESSMKVQIDMYDNFSVSSKVGEQITSVTTTEKYRQTYAPYVDKIGECKSMEIALYNGTLGEKVNDPAYPIVSGSDSIGTEIFNETIIVDKNQKEALSFIINYHYVTDVQGLDVYEGLAEKMFDKLKELLPDGTNETFKVYGYGKNKELEYNFEELFSLSIVKGSDNIITMSAVGTIITPSVDIDGWIVLCGEKIPIIGKECKLTKGTAYSVSDVFKTLYLYTLTEQIKNN